MKALGVTGFVLGIIATLLGIYLQFVVVPAAEAAEASNAILAQMGGDNFYESPEYRLNWAIADAVVDFGTIVMGAGLLAFLVSIVPAIKKRKIAWIGVLLGLVTFFLGAAHGTHMFS